MPGFKTEVPHQLDRETATERLKTFLEKVRQQYQGQVSNLQESWNEDTLTFAFSTYGFKISGTLTVAAGAVLLGGRLPLAAMMFKGKIEQTIRDELAKVLATSE